MAPRSVVGVIFYFFLVLNVASDYHLFSYISSYDYDICFMWFIPKSSNNCEEREI